MVDPWLCCSPIFALHVIEDSRQARWTRRLRRSVARTLVRRSDDL
jgi:hypothetical protein